MVTDRDKIAAGIGNLDSEGHYGAVSLDCD